ncbi:MAG: pyruvate, phosphate dikinase, partial [Thermoproteus sp.]
MPKKYVYDFEEADYKNKKLFGGKGASLIQMTQLGLRVPPGFIITTEACKDFFTPRKAEISELEALLERQPPPEVRDQAIAKLFSLINSLDLPPGLWEEVMTHMKRLEEKTGRRFGDPENPLLVSVRSGAAVSMPGMMDTVLNLGLNDQTVKGLAKQTGNEWFAYDAYRRFVNMFGRIVLGIDDKLFSSAWEEIKRKYNAKEDPDVPVEGLKEAVEKFKEIIRRQYGEFPQDPWEQLKLAIKAVFRSWDSPRAIFYRVAEKITPDVADCTAVNVVTMVFGNMGWDSGTGVVFSRDVATGENKLYGEFLPVAQGEDVVAGIRTPMDIEEFRKRFPHLYDELYRGVKLLEKANKDVQDVEFTVERGKLYFLQCRNAKMTPLARVKTAVDMAREGIITKEEALLKVSPDHVLQLLYPRIDPKAKAQPIAKDLPASPGAVSGQLVFHPDDAVKWAREGKRVILARVETKPDDVHGFYAAVGILTSRGGMTSHAAVVARAIGKPAVVGAEALQIDETAKTLSVNGRVLKEGDWVTIDGNTGNVYVGVVPTVEPELIPELEELLKWADGIRRLGVRANADLPEDAALARKFGAEGIGLLRIERMFRKPERLELLRKVILAETREERVRHLEPLYKMLKADFKEIFKIMDGLPVIVRLIDPPLHEFLPKPEEVLQQIYEA